MSKILEKLVEKLNEESIVASFENTDEPSVNINFDSLGESENGVIVMTITKVPMEEIEDYSYYNIFSVIAVNVENEGMSTVLENVNELNMECLLGNYGIVISDGILYHKHVVKVANTDDDNMIKELYDGLVDVIAIIDNDFDAAIGAVTV